MSAQLKPRTFVDRKKFEKPLMTQKAGTNDKKKFGFAAGIDSASKK